MDAQRALSGSDNSLSRSLLDGVVVETPEELIVLDEIEDAILLGDHPTREQAEAKRRGLDTLGRLRRWLEAMANDR